MSGRSSKVRDRWAAAIRRRRPDVLPWLCGQASLLVAAGCAASVVAGFDGGTRTLAGLASVGLVALGVAVVLLRRWGPPRKVVPADAVVAVVAAWVLTVVASTAVYLATGAIPAPGDALFESASGCATTALTVVADPSSLPDGVLVWRAWTQWTAGFGALLVVVVVLPFLGVGVLRRRSGSGVAPGGALLPGLRRLVAIRRRLLATYLSLTAAGALAYLVAGLAPLEATTRAMATISTGGFTDRPALAAFDEPALQWAGIVGMVLAGSGLALVWRGIGDTREEVARSRELRTYGAVLAAGTAVLAVAGPDGAILERVRVALFTTASLVSTTGFAAEDWGTWSELAQVVVVSLLAVGAMSGSPGGGFRILRARVLAAYAAAVLVVEEHPRASVPLTLGDAPVPPDITRRMVGHQVLWIATAFVGAVLLAATGLDGLTSVSGSISALATVGPALGELSPAGEVASLVGPDRIVLGALALTGRLGVLPLLAAVPALVARAQRRPRRRALPPPAARP